MKHLDSLVPKGHSKPIGKYSPGISVTPSSTSRWIFVSGQVAVDADGCVIGIGDAARQATEVFLRIGQVLAQAGGKLSDLVNVVIYLADIGDFIGVSAVRNKILGDPAPASTLVVVNRLAEADCLVEISGIAVVGNSGVADHD